MVLVDALAFGAGAAAALNPCGIGLVPTYLAFLLARPPSPRWLWAAGEGVGAGALMTVGILVPFTALALTFGTVAGWLGPHLTTIGAGVGAALAVWGAALLLWPARAGLALAVALPVPGLRGRGAVGIAVYGLVFAVASLGCTFPIFLSLLAQAAAAGGAGGGLRVVLLYGLGMGSVVTALAVAARTAARAARRFTARAAALSARLTGAVVLASGLFVFAYFALGVIAL